MRVLARGVGPVAVVVVGAALAHCARSEELPAAQAGPIESPTAADASAAPDAGARPLPSAPATATPAPTTTTTSPPPVDTAPPPPPAPVEDAGPPAPVPVVTKVEPPFVMAGLPSATLHVFGQQFVRGALVLVNGTAVQTTFRGASELEALLQANDVRDGGDFKIHVRNPSPGGGLSGAVLFSVREDAPEITGLEPPSVVAGAAGVRVLVRGKGFKNSSLVHVDGAAVATTPSGDGLTFELAKAAVASVRRYTVTVVGFGAAESAPVPFDVLAASP